MYEYVVGSNGIFVRAERPYLKVMIPLSMTFSLSPVRGLAELHPYVEMYSPVPYDLLQSIVQISMAHLPNEHLFYLVPTRPTAFSRVVWKLIEPPAVATPGSVHPVDPSNPDSLEALLEIHSHGHLQAFWSGADNQDEIGFKLYGVLGELPNNPTLRLRVGVYGHWWEIDPSEITILPQGAVAFNQPVLAEEQEGDAL
jgi:PRTRC genetic system protein A